MVSIPVIPNTVAAGAQIDIISVTSINTGPGGISGRLAVTQPRRRFNCTVGPDDAPAVRSINYTHRSRWPVAIRDWGDYIFADEVLTYASDGGSNYLAPLRRLIQVAPGARYLHQRVLLPDESETPVVLMVDGTPLPRSDWVFDFPGIISVPISHVPSGSILTWSGNALVPVCFDDGTLTVQINVRQQTKTNYGIQSIPQVAFKEIFEAELIKLMTETDDSI